MAISAAGTIPEPPKMYFSHCCSRNTVIDTDKARGRAHNDRQFSADGTEGIQLEQGYDAGNEHRVLQKGNPEVAEACADGD